MKSQVYIFGPAFSTCVRSVQLVCEEKAIPYRTGMEMAGQVVAMYSAAHYSLHPFGKVPVLVHGERCLVETPTILRYLDITFGPATLQGEDLWSQTMTDQWCTLISQYVDRYMVREFMLEMAFPQGPDGQPRWDRVEAGRPKAVAALEVVSSQLADQPFLLGDDFTLPDALLAPMLAYNAEAPEAFNLVAQFANLPAYVERLRQRPAGQRVLKPAAESLAAAS